MTFIPLVTEQLKNLPLSAITIIRSMCWKEAISHSNTISHMHLPNASNISPDKFAKYCYQGIGRLLQPIAYTNTEQAITCYRGNQPTYREDCLIGTLKTILSKMQKQTLRSSSAVFQSQIFSGMLRNYRNVD